MAAVPHMIKLEREKAGLTQRDLAKALDCSVAKVVRVEQGQVSLKISDLRAMLQLFGITDPNRVDEMVKLAREELRHRREHGPALVKMVTLQVEAADCDQAATVINALRAAVPPECPHTVSIKEVRRYS